MVYSSDRYIVASRSEKSTAIGVNGYIRIYKKKLSVWDMSVHKYIE